MGLERNLGVSSVRGQEEAGDKNLVVEGTFPTSPASCSLERAKTGCVASFATVASKWAGGKGLECFFALYIGQWMTSQILRIWEGTWPMRRDESWLDCRWLRPSIDHF